jgi:hypothetical protein
MGWHRGQAVFAHHAPDGGSGEEAISLDRTT